jgi:hypothetical protein
VKTLVWGIRLVEDLKATYLDFKKSDLRSTINRERCHDASIGGGT